MTIDTNNLVSIAEASEDFQRVARLVDETGSVVILMNNTPRYIIKEFASEDANQTISDEDLLKISDPVKAYETLVTSLLRDKFSLEMTAAGLRTFS